MFQPSTCPTSRAFATRCRSEEGAGGRLRPVVFDLLRNQTAFDLQAICSAMIGSRVLIGVLFRAAWALPPLTAVATNALKNSQAAFSLGASTVAITLAGSERFELFTLSVERRLSFDCPFRLQAFQKRQSIRASAHLLVPHLLDLHHHLDLHRLDSMRPEGPKCARWVERMPPNYARTLCLNSAVRSSAIAAAEWPRSPRARRGGVRCTRTVPWPPVNTPRPMAA